MAVSGARLMADAGQLLIMAGMAPKLVPVAVAHLMHESKDGTSPLAVNCNNYGGITYVKQSGATKCPNKQGDWDGGKNYAQYATLQRFINDYVRVLKFNRGSGRPFDAKNINEFVTRLKENGYFRDSKENVSNGIRAYITKYFTPALAKSWASKGGTKLANKKRDRTREAVAAQDKGFSLQAWFEGQSALNKALLIGLTGLLVSKVLK